MHLQLSVTFWVFRGLLAPIPIKGYHELYHKMLSQATGNFLDHKFEPRMKAHDTSTSLSSLIEEIPRKSQKYGRTMDESNILLKKKPVKILYNWSCLKNSHEYYQILFDDRVDRKVKYFDI